MKHTRLHRYSPAVYKRAKQQRTNAIRISLPYDKLVDYCGKALLALGEARLSVLRIQLDPATRISLAKAVLPFNFR